MSLAKTGLLPQQLVQMVARIASLRLRKADVGSIAVASRLAAKELAACRRIPSRWGHSSPSNGAGIMIADEDIESSKQMGKKRVGLEGALVDQAKTIFIPGFGERKLVVGHLECDFFSELS